MRNLNVVALVDLNSQGFPGAMRATVEVLSDWEHPLSCNDITGASDGVLMLGLRALAPEALAEAFRRHRNDVGAVARRLLRGSINVDDIIDDVFERLCRYPDRFDSRRGSPVCARTSGWRRARDAST